MGGVTQYVPNILIQLKLSTKLSNSRHFSGKIPNLTIYSRFNIDRLYFFKVLDLLNTGALFRPTGLNKIYETFDIS